MTVDSRELQVELFGRQLQVKYTPEATAWGLLDGRFALGWIFLFAGIDKLGVDEGWTSAGFLSHISPDNPFQGLFDGLAGDGWVDFIVPWSQVAIGVALISGTLLRAAAFFGALMMILFWATSLTGGLLDGLPIGHGWFISEHLVYAAGLFVIASLGAGRLLGIDGWLEQREPVSRVPALRWVLG